MKNPSIAASFSCFFIACGCCCVVCDAQSIPNVDSASPKDLGANSAAQLLAEQLKSTKPEVRENAATALEAMGTNAADALANYICANLPDSSRCTPTPTPPPRPNTRRENRVADMQSTIKAVVVLGKIGKDVADDDDVRKALLAAANLPENTNWPQLQLAAIDALGEINKYRGVLLSTDDDDPMDTFAPAKAASEELLKIANKVFEKLSTNRSDAPVPQDAHFYQNIVFIQQSQAELLHLAAQISAAASSLKKKKKETTEPPFLKLADAESLAASLRKIEIGYLDATKTLFAKDPVKAADQADDKSHWQLQTEAAYDLLTETTQLNDELDALSDFTDDRAGLVQLLSDLATIPANSELIKAAVASAINQIFSKPPEEKPPAEEAKKEGKKDGEKKDADKNNSTAAKGADKEKSKAK